jgi:hypothetical protein
MCRWSVSGGRACGTVRECHRLVDGASERLVGACDCSAVRVSAAAAAQIVVQPVVWQQANGHAQLAAGAIETAGGQLVKVFSAPLVRIVRDDTSQLVAAPAPGHRRGVQTIHA